MSHMLPSAQLWIGDHAKLIAEAEQYLKTVLCPDHACLQCITCRLIHEKQHHAVVWLAPEKHYTLAALEPILETCVFALQQDQHFFFIIQKADFLPAVCQNMLLKTVEEPPRGYHFIFLAEHKDALLPTIQSRCHITIRHQQGTAHEAHAALIELYTTAAEKTLLHRADEIEKKNISEQETTEILNAIIAYWMQKFTQTHATIAHKKLNFFLNAQQQLPMPGSSKLFWKNLLLQWHHSFPE